MRRPLSLTNLILRPYYGHSFNQAILNELRRKCAQALVLIDPSVFRVINLFQQLYYIAFNESQLKIYDSFY